MREILSGCLFPIILGSNTDGHACVRRMEKQYGIGSTVLTGKRALTLRFLPDVRVVFAPPTLSDSILLALLRDGNNAATELLGKLHADLAHIKHEVEEDIERCNNFNDTARSLDLNAAANKVMRLTLLEARVLKSTVADAEHLLLALLKDGHNMAADVLSRNEVSYDKVFDLLSIKSDSSNAPSMGGGDFFEDDEEDEDEEDN